MKYRIVTDSSANLLTGGDVVSVPLKIVTDSNEFVDDSSLNTKEMLEKLSTYKGRSGTSCPNVGEWLDAFGDAQWVFALAITSGLSGSYNASVQAAQAYADEHPERRVCCLDTLSTGPEMVLIVEELRRLIALDLSFEEIEVQIRAYMETTHLMFMLESLENLAKNGRVSPIVAAAAGLLGIRIVGSASAQGTLQQEHKARGEKKALETLLKSMVDKGYEGGKVRIAHSHNLAAAMELSRCVRGIYPHADVQIHECRGLCCFYAEQGGLLVGFEA